jgi:hypothetical protein
MNEYHDQSGVHVLADPEPHAEIDPDFDSSQDGDWTPDGARICGGCSRAAAGGQGHTAAELAEFHGGELVPEFCRACGRVTGTAAASCELCPERKRAAADAAAIAQTRDVLGRGLPEGLIGHEQTIWYAHRVGELGALAEMLAARLERRLR